MSDVELEFLEKGNKESIDMCSMYWDVDQNGDFSYSVSAIAKEFGKTTFAVTKEVKNACMVYSVKTSCSICDSPDEYTSRADFKGRFRKVGFTCDDCIAEEKLQEEKKKQVVLDSNMVSCQDYPFKLEQLTFTDAVYLLSVLRYQASEDLKYLKPYSSNQTEMLSPAGSYDMGMYRGLLEKNIITVSPKTAVKDISLVEEGGFRYSMESAFWEVLIDESECPTAVFIENLEQKLSSMDWDEDWYDEAKELCQDICVQESIAYLEMVMSEHKFDFSAGEKTVLVISKVLEKHSVAQLYNLIWSSAKDAASYYMRGNIPRRQAANSVIGGIERKFERYAANGWEIKPFRRNYNLPASVLSQVLFVTTLHTDDGGFHKPWNKVI